MINIFRKIRKNLLFNNKVSRYLIYAIGEIALVMIGILLALQVNNWNENRKQNIQLNAILQTVTTDLVADTLSANTIIKYYEQNHKNSQRILNGDITMDNIKDCLECIGLATIYQPFNTQTKGYEQLKNLTESQLSEKDSLLTDITLFYSNFKPVIEKNNDRMENLVMKNVYDFEKYPWFVDLAQGNLTDELLQYFALSEDFKTKVASHSMLALGNHLRVTKQYKIEAQQLITRINNQLEKAD